MFDHNIFQENLVGVDFCEKMVAETNPGVLDQANRTEAPHAEAHGYATIGDIMRSLNPFSGRVLPGGAPGQSLDPGDVLPDGGTPRPSVHPVSRRGRHHRHHPALHRLLLAAHALRGVHEAGGADARRPLRLLLRGPPRLRGGGPAPGAARVLGGVPGSAGVQLRVQGHDPLGPGHGRHARSGGRREARHQRPRRHQPRHPDPARFVVLRRLGGPGDVRRRGTRWGTRSTAAIPGTSTPTRSPRSATSTPTTAG